MRAIIVQQSEVERLKAQLEAERKSSEEARRAAETERGRLGFGGGRRESPSATSE